MSSTAFPPLSPSEPPRVFGAPTLHTDNDLLALGMAADGTLWSVEEPGLLRQWSLATRRQISEKSLDEAATVWAFNWAARLLASGSSEVDVWEVSSGEQLIGWAADSWVTVLAFQPGAPLLATGHDDGVVRVWDWADRRLLHELRGHEAAISAVSFNWDRSRLATAGEDRLIRLWDLAEGKRVATLEGHTDRIPGLAWHPDNRRLFSAGWDTTVRVWDVEKAEPIILLNSHAPQVHAQALSADGRLLAVADSDHAVHLWDTSDYQTLDVLREQTGEVRVMCFPPDDGKGNRNPPLLAFGGADRVIHLWDSRQGPAARGVDPLLARTNIAVSPDGRRLCSLGGGIDLRAWEIESGRPVLELEGGPLLRCFALAPDGKTLAAARFDQASAEDRTTLALYDAAGGRRLAVCDGQKAPITTLAFRPDGAVLASGGVQSTDVWLWQVPSGQPLLIIPDAVDECSVEALAFGPSGSLLAVAGIDYLATGGDDGQVALWKPAEKLLYRALPGGATALAWHPDGRHLAAASLRKVIRVWDTQDERVTGRGPAAVRLELAGHQDTILALAYSPDGRWLASAGDDRTVRLWDSRGGEQAAAWELDNQVKALAFSPDGKWLFTGNGNTSCYQIEVKQLLASGM
jgi:WD40 repeat protein